MSSYATPVVSPSKASYFFPVVDVSSKMLTSPAAVSVTLPRAWTSPSTIMSLPAVINTFASVSAGSLPAATFALSQTNTSPAAPAVMDLVAMTFAFSVTQMSPAVALRVIVLSAATMPLSEILMSLLAVPVRSPPAATFALLATRMSPAVAVASILPEAATTPMFWTLTLFAARSVICLSPLNVFSSTTVPAITVAGAAASLFTTMSPF